jgi:hypothetical protein
MSEFGMFTDEGNQLVARIAAAGARLAAEDGAESAWGFCLRKLETLSYGEGCGEAMDTDVRERVYGVVVAAAEDTCDFYQ